MKKLFTLLSFLGMMLVATPTLAVTYVGDAVKDAAEENLDDETKEDIAEVRKAGVTAGIEQARKVLAAVEAKLDDAEYVSEDTEELANQLLDEASAELDELEQAVEDAETNEELDEAREELVAWLADNQQEFKELMVLLYIDGLNGSIEAQNEVVKGAEALVKYYQRYDLDTTELEAAVEEANSAIEEAEPLVEEATENPTQDSLQAASEAVVESAQATTAVVEESDALLNEMSSAEADEDDAEEEEEDESEDEDTSDEDDSEEDEQ